MATRADEWLTRVEEEGPTQALLDALTNTSGKKVGARMRALVTLPKDPRIGAAMERVFRELDLKYREHLDAAATAAGLALIHGARAEAFKAPPESARVSGSIAAWYQRVNRALWLTLSKPASASTADVQDAWLKRAARRNADDVHDLLERFAEAPATQIAERGLALLQFAVDARIADAALSWMLTPPVRSSTQTPAFVVLALVTAVHGNRTHAERVRKVTEKLPSLSWLERVLPDRDGPAIPQAPTSVVNDTEFLRAIAEAPNDDGRAGAYMDWLLERDEPLGTFMALQRSSQPLTPKQEKQLHALRKKNVKSWLRSLARGYFSGSAVFRRGVLREVALRCWNPASVPRPDEPLLATLESLDLDGGTNLPLGEFLSTTRWPQLRSLIMPVWLFQQSPDSLLAQLEELGLHSHRDPLAPLFARALPKVRRLVLRGEWAPWRIDEIPLANLEALSVETSSPADWERLRGKIPHLELSAGGATDAARREATP